ncbi:MAG: hypothetical protein ABIX28_06465 [Vicinamibacterales bacterium]
MVTAGQPLDGNGPTLFENTAKGPLTLFGRITGVRYHFPGPGARVLVDVRDAPSFEVVQGVEVVRGE